MRRRFRKVGGAALLFALAFGAACKGGAENHFERGVKQWGDGRHHDAITTLRVVTREHPESEIAPRALLKIAQIQAYDLERFDEAENSYQLFLKLYGKSSQAPEALEQLTILLFEKKRDYLRAIRECRRYIDLFPTSNAVPAMHRRIVSSYLELRDFEQARAEAGLFLRKFPVHELADEVAYDIPRSYFIEGNPRKAAEIAKKHLAERPQSRLQGRTQFLLAAALEESDRLAEALEAYKVAREWHPEPSIVDGKIMAVEARIARKHN